MAYSYPTVFPLVKEGNVFSGLGTTVSDVWELIPTSYMSEDAVAPAAPLEPLALVWLDDSNPLLSPANSDWSYSSVPVGLKPMNVNVSLSDAGRGGEDEEEDAAGSGQAAVKVPAKRRRDGNKELAAVKRAKVGEKENVVS